MSKEKQKTKNSLKAYFLIINMVVATVAFSYLAGAELIPITRLLDPIGGSSLNSYSSSPMPTSGGCGSACVAAAASSASTTAEAVSTSPLGVNVFSSYNPYLNPDLGTTGIQTTLGAGSVVVKPAEVGSSGIVTVTSGLKQGVSNYFSANVLLQNLVIAGAVGGIGALVGGWAGGRNGELWGFLSFFAGATVYQIFSIPSLLGGWAILPGVGVAAAIFLLTYKKPVEQKVEFNCLPWQAPIGGRDCELCNKLSECSEYTCKSLGQACGIINPGTSSQKCVWLNPYDTQSPLVSIRDISKGYKSIPDQAVRPPATGVEVITDSGLSVDNADCIKAFFPLEFTISTNEPSQCKLDYQLKNFSEMSFYVGADSLFAYNHTEKLSLPGPDTVNKLAPELHNDGIYTLYVRCQDANGNLNVNPFSVKFCVEKGPDTTPPYIVNVSIPSGSPINYNRTTIPIEVYVNEPSECKWSSQDIGYDSMEHTMNCDSDIWDMNGNEVYTCRTTLSGLESRKENNYYFKCKDQPWETSARNTMSESYSYTLIGTQPLNIISVGPNETIYGGTDSIPVYLTINTDNGYNNGEAICYYSPSIVPVKDNNWIEFFETKTNQHKQRQDLVTGNYIYYFKCVDLGGNAVYNSTSFRVQTDKQAPAVVRVYKESSQLKIITSKKSDCSYSLKDCNFEIDSGIKMTSTDYLSHTADWKLNQNYNIRCKDKYGNQPDPNTCSIVVKASKLG
jgi:hypothetical protein